VSQYSSSSLRWGGSARDFDYRTSAMDRRPSLGLRGQAGLGDTHSVEALNVGDVPVDCEVAVGGHAGRTSTRTSTRTPRARNKRHVRSDMRALRGLGGVVVGASVCPVCSASALRSGGRELHYQLCYCTGAARRIWRPCTCTLGLGPASLKRGLACHGHSGRGMGCCPDAAARLVSAATGPAPSSLQTRCYMLHDTYYICYGRHRRPWRQRPLRSCACRLLPACPHRQTSTTTVQTAVDTRLPTIASCGAQLGMGPRALLAPSRPRPRTWGRAPATSLPPPCFAVSALAFALPARASLQLQEKNQE